jgi:hypothetical protein
MAWVEKNGRNWQGRYKGPDGRNLVAGTAASKRAALKLAQAAEAELLGGAWADPRLGKTTFGEYFVHDWLPNRLIADNTKDTYPVPLTGQHRAHLRARAAQGDHHGDGAPGSEWHIEMPRG